MAQLRGVLANRSAVIDVLSISSFRSLWFGQIFSQLAMNMLLFLLGLVLYQKTGSNAAVSGIFLAYGLPAVIFGMLAGVVVDHLDRRTVLIICDVVRAVILAPLFLVSDNVLVVYVFVFINAVISQLYVPAEAPTIPHLVPSELLVTANSMFSFTFYTSMALGFVLAGPLLQLVGETGGMALIGGLFVLAAISVSRIPRQGDGVRSFIRISRYPMLYILQRIRTDFVAGISYIAQAPALKDALVLLTSTQIVLAVLAALGPGFADSILGIDVAHASTLIIGPVILGIVMGALWVGARGFRIASRKLISVGILSGGFFLLLIPLFGYVLRVYEVQRALPLWALVVFAVFFFLLGVANSFLDVPANSILQRESQGSMRGRVYGVLTATVGGVGIAPVIIGGVLADRIGVGMVIFLVGCMVFVYGAARMRYNR